jgi:preprotein translocase SecE subunit
MAFGIHKPEQGYWVRVLTAVCAGVLVLAGAAWGWAQAGAVNLPARGYILELQSVNGSFAPGGQVEVVGISDDAEGREITLGNAGVVSFAATGARTASLEIDKPETAGEFRIDQAERVRSGEAVGVVRARTIVPIFPLIYLQAGVTGVLMLTGAIAVYWFAALNHKSVDFLINTDGEMRKVNWSTRKEIIGSTQVVIVAAFLIAAILFGIDTAFAEFFRLIGVLES